MTDTEEPKNIFRIMDGGKTEPVVEDGIPQNEYRIVDRSGFNHYHDGFLLFTSHHVAVMRDTDAGGLPVFILPLDQLAFAELVEEDEIYEEVL